MLLEEKNLENEKNITNGSLLMLEKKMKKIKEKYSKEWLSEQEITILFSNPEIKYRNFLLMNLCYTGALRISEALIAKFEDFKNENYAFLVLRTQKTDKLNWEIQPIPLLTYTRIKQYCKSNNIKSQDNVFQSRQKNSLSYDRAYQIIKECCKKAGINKEITTHTFRRSRLQHLLNNGKDIHFVQDFARHKSIDTTRKYLKISKKEIADKMNEIDKKSLCEALF